MAFLLFGYYAWGSREQGNNILNKNDDHWDVCFRGVTIWPYLRFKHHGKKITPYRQSYKFHPSALILPFVLLLNPVLWRRPVVALVARKGLLDFMDEEFEGQRVILVTRTEQQIGNSILVEAVWKLFRKSGWFFARDEYKRILDDLNHKGLNSEKYSADIKVAIGDYFYNVFLGFFLRNGVFYTNCLVPKIEKYMGRLNSTEVQHGVIHADHMDYANIDGKLIKNRLLVWNKIWGEKLRRFGYGGELIVATHDYISVDDGIKRAGIFIFTTVDDSFSRKVEAYKGGRPLHLQRHPRDYYPYSKLNGFCLSAAGGENLANYAICHDSTLIFSFVANSVFFVYLMVDGEEAKEVALRLKEKYGAVLGDDFEVSDTLEEALTRIDEKRLCVSSDNGLIDEK